MRNMNISSPNFQNGRLSSDLCEIIEERIATGDYPPGFRLDECKLAAEFGASRTPIREALIQLNSEGLVDMRPRRGVTVVEVPPQRLCEMFEVMAELEAMCARLAARRITPDEESVLRAAHEASRQANEQGDANTYFYLNEKFHQAIYKSSHNRFLNEQALQLQRRLRPYRRLQLHVRDRVRASFAEHQAIVDAICSGESEQAQQLLRLHVSLQGERFVDLIASLSTLKQAN